MGEEAEPDDGLPWACFICRQDFNDPVVTKCGHFFCRKCAIERYATDTSCACCREPTAGLFNTAKQITEKLERRKAKQAAAKATIEARKSKAKRSEQEELNSSDEEKAVAEYREAMERRGA